MPYTFTLTTTIPATPEEIYEASLDSIGHSEMTGGAATMSGAVGADVTAWDGYISGRNLELIPGERIVQSWRTTRFADADEDSVITVILREIEEGTLLTLEHSNVPDDHKSYEEGGWQSNYFEPMVAYFTEIKADIAEPAPGQAPSKSAPAAPPKKAAKPPAKSGKKSAAKKRAAGGARRNAKAKPTKRASPPAKAVPKKKQRKAKANARAAARRTRRKSSAGKTGRGRRR